MLKSLLAVGILFSINSFAIDLNGTWKGTTQGSLESTQGWEKNCLPFEFVIEQSQTKLIFRSSHIECGSITNNWEYLEFQIKDGSIFQDLQQSGLVKVGEVEPGKVWIQLKRSYPFSFNFFINAMGQVEYQAKADLQSHSLEWNNELTKVNP